MKKALTFVGVAALLLATSCSGVRTSTKTFAAHGEAFRIFGFALPGDDQEAALNKVPAGATITNVNASAADWTSFIGFFGNLLGFSGTNIGGTK